jgi:hypothetical protein
MRNNFVLFLLRVSRVLFFSGCRLRHTLPIDFGQRPQVGFHPARARLPREEAFAAVIGQKQIFVREPLDEPVDKFDERAVEIGLCKIGSHEPHPAQSYGFVVTAFFCGYDSVRAKVVVNPVAHASYGFRLLIIEQIPAGDYDVRAVIPRFGRDFGALECADEVFDLGVAPFLRRPNVEK